ncbi:sulfatase [Puteibacter caeruleilacunae]|nr:sulfatase [Puteibacter caeruleilacunae]
MLKGVCCCCTCQRAKLLIGCKKNSKTQKIMNLKILVLLTILIPIITMGQDKPNILFIVSEDNGPDLGCYGAPVATPNLDKLAERGVLFENAYVPQAGCSQSRAAFFTGLYPHQNGQIGLATWEYRMYEEVTPNMPSNLKKAGYRTANIGKVHVNPESALGFDITAVHSSNFHRKGMARYADEARKFINAGSEPFYLQVNYPDAHRPFLRQVDGLPKKPLTAKDVKSLPYMMVDNQTLRQVTADYYNCMMRLDTYIGDLLRVLKESGKYENTLIVYIGDHGADLLRGKRTSYEGGTRIPMIIEWPERGVVNKRLKEFANTIDLFPTFLDVAGAPLPEGLPGRSLVPLLKGKRVNWREYLFTEYHTHSNHNPYPQRTVRDNRFKLIYNLVEQKENPGYEFTFDHLFRTQSAALLQGISDDVMLAYQRMLNPPEFELYDLKNDPYEKINLAEDQKHAKVLARLVNALKQWQKDTHDPLIERSKALELFNIIQETGTNKKERKMVPYFEIMNH